MKLLKTAVFVFFFSLMLNSANAQGWGVRAGVNFSTLSNGDVNNQTGLYAGLYKQFSIIPKLLFIQPEIQYSKQGFDTHSNSYDLHYIQVPVLAKLYFLKIISVETGPQFGFLAGNSTNAPTKPNYNTFDPAWDFGLSFNLPFGLSIDGRYITSFDEVVNHSGSKNQVFQLGAGFKF